MIVKRNILSKVTLLVAIIFVSIFVPFPSPAKAWVASGTPLSYAPFASGIKYATQIAIDSSGNVYQSGYEGCCTVGHKGVAKYDSAGTFLTKFGPVDPTGVGVDNDGNILIMDYQQNFVKKFTNTGTPIDISSTDMGSYAYQAPYTVAIDSVGNVYVADIFLNRIIKFNSSYAFDSNITGNSGAFSSPQGVAVDGSDNVYVLDSGNNRVQKFNSSGTWQLTVTGNGTAFNYPEAMTVDTNGNIYVADSGNNRIQIFNTSGVFQQQITSTDVNTGTGSPISYLSGMGFQNPNTLFVGDNTRSFKIVFDHDDPTVTITPLAGNNTTSPTPTFTGTASDPTTVITNVEYSIDSGAYSSCVADDALFDELSETFSCSVSPALDSGAHTIDVRGTDSKNNTKVTNYAFTATLPAADTYTYGWTKIFQGSNYEFGYSVKTDNSGNLYTTGSFDSTVDFEHGAGVDNHTSVGSSDIFLTKYNADGSYGWTKTWGGTSSDNGNGVSTDSSGNIYVTGYFSNTTDFDPGAGVDNHTSTGNYDIFLTKFNADGSYSWTKTVGGSGTDISNSVSIDSTGNIYTSGYYSSAVDFDPGAGVDNHSFSGTTDIFLTKYNSDGSYAWTKTVGGIGAENATSIKASDTSSVYVTGYFESTTDFNPEAGTDNHTPVGGRDIFLTKYNSDGSYAWTKTLGAAGFDFSNSVTTDNSGNIFITGPFESTFDFDPGAGVDNHTSASGYDLFITKFNSDGTYGWTKTVGGSGTDYGTSLTTDTSGNIYATGFFSSTVDFKPGAGVDSRTSVGSDVYITSYTNDGTYRWVHTATSDSGTDGYAITYDLTNNSIYTTGDFGITVDFNPLGAHDIVTTDSNWSGWIMQLTAVDPAVIPTPSPSPSTSSTTPSPTVLGTTTDINTNCSALAPDSAPNIFKISRSGTEVNIFYSPISSNVTTYQLMYGFKPADERFAVTFNAELSTGALKYTVNDLVQTQTYSFWMRGKNDCMPGPWSNTYTVTGLWVSPDASPTSSTTSQSNSQTSSGADSTNSTDPSAPTDVNFEITVIDPLGMPIAGVPVSITPATETIPAAESVIKNDSNNNGTIGITVLPGEYTLTTTVDNVSYSQGMILSATTTSLRVSVPIPLKKSIERQIMDAPIDATYAVKAGLAGIVVNSTIASLIGLFAASNLILASLFSIYTSTSRSFLRLPFDYLDSLIKFTTLSLSTKLAPIFPALRRKKKSNGLVFDAYSFKPLQKVYVILFSSSGNLKTDFTDEYGRYNFDDVAPDDYQLRTEAPGYKFPSTIITTSKTNDIEHIYQPGEILPVSQDVNILREVAVPMDPSEKLGLLKVIKLELSRTIKKMVAPSYLISILVVAAAVITNPSQFNQIITMLVGSALLVKVNADKHYKRLSGQLLNPSRLPISEAVVKLYKTYSDGSRASLYTTTKTDKSGRYYIQPEIGNYILEILTNDGQQITQTVRIMKNVPTVDRVITVQNESIAPA